MKIVATDYYCMNPGDLNDHSLRSFDDFKSYDVTRTEDIIPRCIDADIIITNKTVFDKEIIRQLPNLKFICVSATGYNCVDTKAARARGIIVSNVSNYSTHSVAQHVFSMILSLKHQVEKYSHSVKAGHWSESKHFSYWEGGFTELKGKTLGLLGYGNIAKQVCTIAKAFGMNVMVHHPNKRASYPDHVTWVSQSELWSQCDILSLHAPLTEKTRHIICKSTLEQMKSDCLLINTARGGHVQELDLANHLHDNPNFYVALDVLSSEPPQAKHILYGCSNCYITPHQAWSSREARQTLLNGVYENIMAFKKEAPINVVN